MQGEIEPMWGENETNLGKQEKLRKKTQNFIVGGGDLHWPFLISRVTKSEILYALLLMFCHYCAKMTCDEMFRMPCVYYDVIKS